MNLLSTPYHPVSFLRDKHLAPLYVRHRPMQFSQLKGQDSVVDRLVDDISGDSVAPHYLFSGPAGTGKSAAAELLMKSLRCVPFDSGDSCDRCGPRIEHLKSTRPLLQLVPLKLGGDPVAAFDAQLYMARQEFPNSHVCEVEISGVMTRQMKDALRSFLDNGPVNLVAVLCARDEKVVPPDLRIRSRRLAFGLLSDDLLYDCAREVAGAAGLMMLDDEFNEAVSRGGGSAREMLAELEEIAGTQR